MTGPPWPRLVGLGTATPALCVRQDVLSRRLADLWGLGDGQLSRWQRIVAGCGIETRHGVMPIEEILGLTTRDRMAVYEAQAPALAEAAAARALARAGVDAGRVTDLVVVSCTGFWAPGLDVSLVERLALAPTVRRTTIGFMGCFGAVIGLRTAVGACRCDDRAVALVLCLELCSLHLRADSSPQNLVASALFADGAAAAVVTAGDEPGPVLGRVTPGHSRLIPRGRDWMTWRITDSGFAMTLDREVPGALRDEVAAIVGEVAPTRPRCFVVHPGGPGILDAVDLGLGLGGASGVEVARDVLRRCGNMSSATLLFVLAEALDRGYRPPALLMAFGPGLAVETLELAAES